PGVIVWSIAPLGIALTSVVGSVDRTVSAPSMEMWVTLPRNPLGVAGPVPAAMMSPGCAAEGPCRRTGPGWPGDGTDATVAGASAIRAPFAPPRTSTATRKVRDAILA